MVLDLPHFISKHRQIKTVTIDDDIVDVIKELWRNKIYTLGSCSGHGEVNPSIVITESYYPAQIEIIKKIIAKVDDREWDIFQWRLCKV